MSRQSRVFKNPSRLKQPLYDWVIRYDCLTDSRLCNHLTGAHGAEERKAIPTSSGMR